MFKNYLLMTLRNLNRNKGYSAISIFGLALAMAVFFLIQSFVIFETNYESFEPRADRIYNTYWKSADKNSICGNTPYMLAKVFRENYSDVAICGQISEEFDYGRLKVINDENEYPTKNVFYVEPQIFDILSFDLLSGSSDDFKSSINSVLLSESAADRYFAGKVTVGDLVNIKSIESIVSFRVAGIFKNRPADSQLRPEILFNMDYFKSKLPTQYFENWGVNNPVTYFMLAENTSPNVLISSIRSIQKNLMPEFRQGEIFEIIPTKDVHLKSAGIWGFFGETGDIDKLYIFASIGILILLIAGINFVNLNIARASVRIKEIIIRKLLGAGKRRLFFQIIFESIVLSFIALPLTLLFIELTGELFYSSLNREINALSFNNIYVIVGFLSVPLLLGIMSGLYTAYYSVKHISVEDINGKSRVISGGTTTRRLLIGFQFVVFIGLMIFSIVIYKQINMMVNDNLGYDKNNLLIIDVPDEKYNNSIPAFVSELKNQSGIVNVTYTSSLPPATGNIVFTKIASKANPDVLFDAQMITSDENYLQTLGLQIMYGRNYDPGEADDKNIIINELAAEKLGLGKHPVDEVIMLGNSERRIICVVKNFFAMSVYDPMSPVIILRSNEYSYKLAVKYSSGELSAAKVSIDETWKEFFNESILNVSFNDEILQKTYVTDIRFSKIIFFFTIISIFISVIGLAGLTAIVSARRKKEIGIRKVLGASTIEMIRMLSKEVVLISVASTIIACPPAFYIINSWLDNYAYKVDLSILYPVTALLSGLFIALLTVSFQTFKSASANPIKSLKYE